MTLRSAQGQTRYRFRQPPRALRRPGVKLDNLAVVPASMLPYRKEWQAVVNSLPAGAALIILPTSQSKPRAALEQVARQLRAKGHPVTTITTDQVAVV